MFVGLGLLQVYQSFEVEVLVFHINMEKEQGKLNMNLFGLRCFKAFITDEI